METLGKNYCFGHGRLTVAQWEGLGIYGNNNTNAPLYRELDYQHNDFNDPNTVTLWKAMGHNPREGLMYDMSRPVPEWFNPDVLAEAFPWENIGWSFYKMGPGACLPEHVDAFRRFKQKFKTEHRTIMRAVIFLEDWKSGHYLEVADEAVTDWAYGDFVWWTEKAPHIACNVGNEDRYTLQITGITDL